MLPDSFRIFTNFTSAIFESSAKVVSQQAQAVYHRHTYQASPDALNVVVIGGSFAGLQLAKRLSQSLPSGYRVVLIEKNSHFNFNFNFPRYAVVGDERKAFIPYSGAFGKAPAGSWQVIRDTAFDISNGRVLLESGVSLPYAYLAIATGFRQSLPARMVAPERDDACRQIRELRAKITSAQTVAIVGGGPVGVQLSTDIKSAFPDKSILLAHSRDRLLNSFGKRLSSFVESRLGEMGIEVVLNERPEIVADAAAKSDYSLAGIQESGMLVFQNNRQRSFDLIIKCAGALPNTDFMTSTMPTLLSAKTGRVLVRLSLQVDDANHLNVFALGDIADCKGPKMGRSAMSQADLVALNIVAMIRGSKLRDYEPEPIDGMLKLSLGLENNVTYVLDGKGGDLMVPGKSNNIDLEAGQAWWYLNGNMKEELSVRGDA